MSPRKLAGLLLATLACGCNTEPPLYPVEGTVTLDGRPLTTGDVLLFADDGAAIPANRVPQGTVNAQGVYALTTGGKPGVPAGRYRVVVVAQSKDRPRNVPANPMGIYPLVHPKFFSPDTSPLRIEVGPDRKADEYRLPVSR